MPKKKPAFKLNGKPLLSREAVQGRLDAELVRSLRAQIAEQKKEIGHIITAFQKFRDAKPVPTQKPNTRKVKDDFIRVIIGDTHGAKSNPLSIAAALLDVKQLDPDEVILLGDHVDCGGHLAQHHTLGYVAEADYTYEQDIATTARFLDDLQAAAPRAAICYIEGNHERRVETWCVTETLRNKKDAEFLRQVYAPQYLLRLKERGIPYYRQGEFYDGLSLPGTIRRGKCYFTHGSITSVNAARGMVQKLGGNIVFGHIHRDIRATIRTVHSGIIVGQSFGCLCHPQPLWQHTHPTDWSEAYGAQIVSRSGEFLSVPVPIVDGRSLILSLGEKLK